MTNTELITLSKQKYTENEFVGTLIFDPVLKKWNFAYRNDYNVNFAFFDDCENEVICIILESPHIYEFIGVDLCSTNQKIVNSRPLNNTNSRNSLIKILNSSSFNSEFNSRLDNKKRFDIVLVNAVQFQCSLGHTDTSKYRDNTFILNWIECQSTFVDHIKKIDPRLIINCCTKGTWRDDKYIDEIRLDELGMEFSNNSIIFHTKLSKIRKDFTLKDLVECKLFKEGLINDSIYFRYDHPSSFVSKEPRDIRTSDKTIVSGCELVGVSLKKKQGVKEDIQKLLAKNKYQLIRKRFFYGEETYNPRGGVYPTCEKLFVLTEEGYFYSENNCDEFAVDDEAHNFDTFDPLTYKWKGYQQIVEIDEEKAKKTVLKDQKNWIISYLSSIDKYRYIDDNHMNIHYLGVDFMNVVKVRKNGYGVYFAVNENLHRKDPEISKEGIYEFLDNHIANYEDKIQIRPKYGPLTDRLGVKTIFGRVVKQTQYLCGDEFLIFSKQTLENIRCFLKKKG